MTDVAEQAELRALDAALKLSMKNQRRVHRDIPDAPVLRPTPEEFKDPLAYIHKIREFGDRSGIVKIVPPAGWKPAYQPKNFVPDVKFPTKRQELGLLAQGKGFDDGNEYTRESYEKYSVKFREDYLAKHPEILEEAKQRVDRKIEAIQAQRGGSAASVTPQERQRLETDCLARAVEAQYWKIVETGCEEVKIDYANDLDVANVGTAFGPERGGKPNPWDLNHIALGDRSVLRRLGPGISGVTIPWLYHGVLFATFCWHVEDHNLFSIQYLHSGQPKTWYGVPHRSAKKFEKVMKDHLMEAFKMNPDLLHHITTMFSPSLLVENGVDVVRILQEPGTFVVTFPHAYHGGINHGFNCGEAVNFATQDWLPFGRMALDAYTKGGGKRPGTFAHDQLVWEIAEEALAASKGPGRPLKTAHWRMVHEEVTQSVGNELHLRNWLRGTSSNKEGERRDVAVAEKYVGMPRVSSCSEDFPACSVCMTVPFFAVARCDCRPSKAMCLAHSFTGCLCGPSSKRIEMRCTDLELAQMHVQCREAAVAAGNPPSQLLEMLDSMRDTVEDILKHPERYPTPFVAATLPKKDKTLRDLSMKYMGLEKPQDAEKKEGAKKDAAPAKKEAPVKKDKVEKAGPPKAAAPAAAKPKKVSAAVAAPAPAAAAPAKRPPTDSLDSVDTNEDKPGATNDTAATIARRSEDEKPSTSVPPAKKAKTEGEAQEEAKPVLTSGPCAMCETVKAGVRKCLMCGGGVCGECLGPELTARYANRKVTACAACIAARDQAAATAVHVEMGA